MIKKLITTAKYSRSIVLNKPFLEMMGIHLDDNLVHVEYINNGIFIKKASKEQILNTPKPTKKQYLVNTQ